MRRKRYAANSISTLKHKLRSEVNELYTQEHWMMIQADLLEQAYTMFRALHAAGRNRKTVFPKKSERSSSAVLDPDKFVLPSISAKVEKYESIWEDKAVMQKVAEEIGYSLECKSSSIDHPCIVS